MRHCDLSHALTRPPGVPASLCTGELFRVDGSGDRIADDAPPILDTAQAGEGRPGDVVSVELWRCPACRQTLVVATAPGGKSHARNAWDAKPAPRHFEPIGLADPRKPARSRSRKPARAMA